MSANGATKRDLFRVIAERDAEIVRLRTLNDRPWCATCGMLPPFEYPCKDCGRQRKVSTAPEGGELLQDRIAAREYIDRLLDNLTAIRIENETLRDNALTPQEAKGLLVLARHFADLQRETPEWDTWLNLADKLTRISDKPQ